MRNWRNWTRGHRFWCVNARTEMQVLDERQSKGHELGISNECVYSMSWHSHYLPVYSSGYCLWWSTHPACIFTMLNIWLLFIKIICLDDNFWNKTFGTWKARYLGTKTIYFLKAYILISVRYLLLKMSSLWQYKVNGSVVCVGHHKPSCGCYTFQPECQLIVHIHSFVSESTYRWVSVHLKKAIYTK